MPGAFKPPAPQAPVRYRCVQDLGETSLGVFALPGPAFDALVSTMQGAAETSPYKLLNLHPTAWAASEVAVYRGEVAATAGPDHVPIALTDSGRHYRFHRSLVASTGALAASTIPQRHGHTYRLAEDPDKHSAPHRQDNFPPEVATGPPRPTDRRASKRCLSGAYRGGRTEGR
jgi:hypothetical protein